jgi:peptidoglycan/xylan/chitin deacetylase (PgdA/CDA1 family)
VRRDLGFGETIVGRGMAIAAVVTLGAAALLVVAGLVWGLSAPRATVVREAPRPGAESLAAAGPSLASSGLSGTPVSSSAHPLAAAGVVNDAPLASPSPTAPEPTLTPTPVPSPTVAPSPSPVPSATPVSSLAASRANFGPPGARRPSADLPVVMFHYVGPLPPNPDIFRKDLTVSSELLEGVLKYLADQQATTVSFGDVLEHYAGGPELPKRSAILTFDDGYDNAYTEAFPLLQKYGMTGTFYIITDFVGRPNYLTWDQIVEMDAAGMTIGAHTLTHPDLTQISPAELRRQLVESKHALEEHLGHPVVHLSYPAGKYNAATIAATKAAGYATAVTVVHGLAHPASAPFEITRVRAHGADSAAALNARLTPASWRR